MVYEYEDVLRLRLRYFLPLFRFLLWLSFCFVGRALLSSSPCATSVRVHIRPLTPTSASP